MTKGKQWMKTISIIFLIGFLFVSCKVPQVTSQSKAIEHKIWDELLREHVDDDGLVDYQSMQKDSLRLQQYLDTLRKHHPNDKNWSREETMAYWINAYNAFTVELILKHYPVASIKDIKNGVPFVNTVWDIKFIKIEGAEYDLNNIEHGVLRENFDDPRVHFALVCASMSCPKLQNFAFTAEELDAQLEEAGKEFINETFRNDIMGSPPKLSKLLSWYWTDFKDTYSNRAELVNEYAKTSVNKDQEFDFLEYDWTLNEQTPEKKRLLR